MDTLNRCLSANTSKGLDAHGVGLFTALLGHENAEVRSRASQNILRLWYDYLIYVVDSLTLLVFV